ncbi:MAG: outer membrane protein assembly factor BamB family protein, partial [Planctomycetota bacterium]
ASGHDPEHGDGPGHLYAIDGTKRGDITESGKVWHVGGNDFRRTLSTVAIADGLVYAAELNGFLYCFDAKTGRRHWKYDTFAGVWGSPYVVDGKVYLGDEDGEVVVLQHGTTLKELATNDVQTSVYTTPVASNGVLYITNRRALLAIEVTRPLPHTTESSWPMFRGSPRLSGVAASSLPEKLTVRWKFEAPDAVSSSAAIVDGVAYVGCEDEHLYALDMTTGAVRWKYKAEGPVLSSPLVLAQTVYFGDDDGTLHALDVSSGRSKWTFPTESPIISSPNHAQGVIVFGSYNGIVYGLSADGGQQIWKYQTEADRVHGAPGIGDDKVFVGGCDQYLHVLNVSDGKSIRKVSIESVTGASPAVSASTVYIPTYGQQVRGIDWTTGTTLWTYEDAEHQFPYLASPAVTSGAIIVAGRDKRVRSLDSKTGRLNWVFVTKGRVDSSPVVVGKRVFVGSSDGHLYSLDVSSGKETWRFEAGGPITASPAVADGCLVIGTLDGVVYCFGSPAGSAVRTIIPKKVGSGDD